MHVWRRALGAAIGTAAEAFVDAAGRALETERLPPDDHRPWRVPDAPWAMTQGWSDVLFAHWPLRATALRPHVPAALRLETWRGSAWVGITAFVVTGARLRGLPAVPGFADFAEVNVRTYVTAGGKPGVYFFSLDASSALTVMSAWAWYALPYFFADARLMASGNRLTFTSRREHVGAPPAEFEAHYRPVGPVARPARTGFERWLVERYCAYAVDAGALVRAELHHPAWPLQGAEVAIERNTLFAAAGLHITGPPRIAHYSSGVEAVAWAPVTSSPATRSA
ncbi:MAG TPA: DUF2071 domain-containing protein [Terriglobales bacterium]|nr:DUF2071 domain-containing protein [Terriglobales bacterium]